MIEPQYKGAKFVDSTTPGGVNSGLSACSKEVVDHDLQVRLELSTL